MNNKMRHFVAKLLCDEMECEDISEIAGFAFYRYVEVMPEPVAGADGYVYDGMVLPKATWDTENFRYAIMYGSGSVKLYVSAEPIGCNDSSSYATYALVKPPYRVYTYDRATNSWGSYTETAEGSNASLNLSYVMWSNQNITKSDRSIAFEGTTPRAFYFNNANEPTAFLYSSGTIKFQSNSTLESGYSMVGAYVDWKSAQYTTYIRVPWRRIDKSTITGMAINADAIPAHTDYWFYGCTNLRRTSLPDGMTKIGKYMFYNTHLISITLPNTLKEIGAHAYQSLVFSGYIGDISRGSLVIPDSVEKIGDYAFRNAKFHTEGTGVVVIGTGVVEIGKYAFADEYLASVTIGANVKRIDPYAFYKCGQRYRANLSVTFLNTSGWWVSTDEDATSGIAVNVSSDAAKLIGSYKVSTGLAQTDFTYEDGTYVSYYWNRT